MISFALYVICLVCVLVIAAIGVDFSPSFTAIFVMVFLSLTALGEVFLCFREHKHGRVFTFFGRLFPILGVVWALPASYIYAAGDDWIDACLNTALIGSVILHFAVYFLLYRKQGRKLGVAAGIENWILLAAGIFTLSCAVPSTALWPYGFGILLMLTAMRLADVKKDSWLPRGVMTLGMLLCAVFLAAPMVF